MNCFYRTGAKLMQIKYEYGEVEKAAYFDKEGKQVNSLDSEELRISIP